MKLQVRYFCWYFFLITVAANGASILTISHQTNSRMSATLTNPDQIQINKNSRAASDGKKESGSLTELLIRSETLPRERTHKYRSEAGPAVHSYEVFVIFTCKTRLCFQWCVFLGFRRAVSKCFPCQCIQFLCICSDFVALFLWSLVKNVRYYPNEAQFWVPKKHETYSSLMGWHFKLDKLVFTENKSCFHTINLFVEVVFCNWAFEHQVWLHWFTQADLCSNSLDLSAFDSVSSLSSWNTTLVHKIQGPFWGFFCLQE